MQKHGEDYKLVEAESPWLSAAVAFSLKATLACIFQCFTSVSPALGWPHITFVSRYLK